jgi:hypothetical protein
MCSTLDRASLTASHSRLTVIQVYIYRVQFMPVATDFLGIYITRACSLTVVLNV